MRETKITEGRTDRQTDRQFPFSPHSCKER